MSEDVKICPKCKTVTLEPTLDCAIPSEMIPLLRKPIPKGTELRVTPYYCSSCGCVELYAAG
jgi:hypothetical protein